MGTPLRVLLAALLGSAAISEANALPADAINPRVKPVVEAPAAPVAAQSDVERLKALKDLLSRRRHDEARALVALLKDPTARALGEWYYLESEDPRVSVAAADAFLDAHPQWPSAGKIQAHAEKRMASTTPTPVILDFFKTRDPVTGEGKIQLARAQFASGFPEAAEIHVKDAWIKNNFTLADEQQILSNYGGRLSAADHAARADRLLWAREVTTARRVFSFLSMDERRRAEARAALLVGGESGPVLYNSLSSEDRADPGVMLAAIRYFRRAEEEPRAVAIARSAPRDAAALRDPARWWDEQQLLMRWALKNRLYADAYAMAALHGLEPGSSDFAEAEFNAGWISLRFLNEPDRAEKHFGALISGVTAPISVSRGWYWLGRVAEARGDKGQTALRYQKAADHIYTFYGQLAAEKLGAPYAEKKFETGPRPTAEEVARFEARPGVDALRLLTKVGDERAFLIFSYAIDDLLESRGEYLQLADLALGMDAPHVAVRAGKVAVRNGAFAPEVAYPAIPVPGAAARFAPAELILGLSRQESEFNPRAYSSAGARGVMQLIPATAETTARKERIPYQRHRLLGDAVYNMTLGSAHLSHLIDRFAGSWILTFVGYNAGPIRADQWIMAYGDPRSPDVDPIDWIEQIPFEETRNYVQRVLENTQIYRGRDGARPIAGSLIRDIERGGPTARAGLKPAIASQGALPDLQPRIVAAAAKVLTPPTHLASTVAVAGLAPATKGTPAASESPKKPRSTRNSRYRPRTPPPAAEPAETPHIAKNAAPPLTPTPAPTPTRDEPTVAIKPAAPRKEEAPLVMAPVDGDAEADSEAAFEEQGLVAPIAQESGSLDAEADNAASCASADAIAASEKEEASADDLNAGALAALRGEATCQ